MKNIFDYQPCKEAACDKYLEHGLAMCNLIHNCVFLNFLLPRILISEAVFICSSNTYIFKNTHSHVSTIQI